MNRRQMEEMGVTRRRDQDGGWDWLQRPTELDQPVAVPMPDANGNYVSDNEDESATPEPIFEEMSLPWKGLMSMSVDLPAGAVWLRHGQVQEPGWGGCDLQPGDSIRMQDGTEWHFRRSFGGRVELYRQVR